MVKRLLRSAGCATLLFVSGCGASLNDALYDKETLEVLGVQAIQDSTVPVPAPAFASPVQAIAPSIDSRRLRPSVIGDYDVGCTFDPDVFQATVVAEAFGDPEQFDLPQQATVESIISNVYNDLIGNGFCDDLSREIFNVSVSNFGFEDNSTAVTRRKLQGSRRRFFFRFFVTGTCRECERDSRLFTDVIETRRWMESIHKRALQGMGTWFDNSQWNNRHSANSNVFDTRSGITSGLVTPGTISESSPDATPSPTSAPVLTISSKRNCDCDDTLRNRSPNSFEFAEIFNLTLSQDNSVDSIDAVTGVAEVQEVNCSAALDEFESQALLDATGNVSLLSEADFDILAQAFVASYNEIAGQNCDPFFRTGVNASVVLEEVFDDDDEVETISGGFADSFNEIVNDAIIENGSLRRRQLRSTRRRVQQKGRKFRFRFSVRGRCIDCARDANLFDDTNSDRRLRRGAGDKRSPAIQTRHLGFLSENGICYCAENAPEVGPDTADFSVTFDNQIQELEDRGEITAGAVDQIDGTIQVDDALPSSMPSVAPSLSPSGAPSSAPSSTPTVVASEIPTSSPSESPSVSPTSSPSESPTGAPSFSPTGLTPTESPAPSPSPSVYPTDRPSSSPSSA
mmetsp:Transcript_19965/g.29578  ORF Transcript_19965/g.29578 Transcript_19965/m.29578 type:complete len:626 (-) Transcript_19965:127-2004(-)|eukprot:CAMPEP_0194049348 /NCGR_PEP_ID=MMETSP0009_2-20130614/30443_1 /TAXON_ID=210454 /ORGANISM="Grammatophora oceanica, Strain CCMP 410" /LENGTH=625 /DNA_ID=CAMNT_0038695481 /DNA_START=272 /DNA_END=2149 /DNA_ORIENTATION=+